MPVVGVVENREPPDGITKHFTVAVFVVHEGHVLLHPHPKVGLWLPPGGHIEPHELPDDAARRETLEETGLEVVLVGAQGIEHDAPGSPRQLLRPEGVQVEDIATTSKTFPDFAGAWSTAVLGGPSGGSA